MIKKMDNAFNPALKRKGIVFCKCISYSETCGTTIISHCPIKCQKEPNTIKRIYRNFKKTHKQLCEPFYSCATQKPKSHLFFENENQIQSDLNLSLKNTVTTQITRASRNLMHATLSILTSDCSIIFYYHSATTTSFYLVFNK